MQFSQINQFKKRPASDLLVIPVIKGENKLIWPKELKNSVLFEKPIQVGDFKGALGDVILQYPLEGPDSRILLLGLGENDAISVEKLRRAYNQAMKSAWKIKAKSLTIIVPEIPNFSFENIIRGISEGLLLTNYSFDRLKKESIKKDIPQAVEKIIFISENKTILDFAHKAEIICKGVFFARDLINDNAEHVTPAFIAEQAKKMAKDNPKVKTLVYDKKWLKKEGMDLILGVNQGAATDPFLIVSHYTGNPKSNEHTILVGKGVTYDTGGLNLKPTGSMETMKSDMSGSAAVLGTLFAVSKLGLKKNVTIVIPTTENAIGPNSFRPGDVYASYLGKTVEIDNTDAEGRLILADALAYSVKHLKPTRIIDIATLTGAMSIALGNEAIGLFSNNDSLADALLQAGSDTFERVWRFPLFEEYKDQLRSDIADIRNHGGRPAGSITAALFLQEFVDNVPWAHLDIAGTAYLHEAKRYHPRFATGVGVRLLTEFIDQL